MNRIYCAIGKIVELTQTIELELGDILQNSEIIKEFGRHAKITREDYEQVLEDSEYIKENIQKKMQTFKEDIQLNIRFVKSFI